MLSTPPAFILSQDQTLIISFCSCQVSLFFTDKRSGFYCFKVASTDAVLQKILSVLTDFPAFKRRKLLESFKVVSLFSYQGFCFCCLKRQLLYLITVIRSCQQLFYFSCNFLSYPNYYSATNLYIFLSPFLATNVILSRLSFSVNKFLREKYSKFLLPFSRNCLNCLYF